MSSRKYHKDYKLIEHVDDSGRVKTETVYCGDKFYYSSGADKAGKALRQMLACSAFSTISYILSLVPYSSASHTMLVLIPYLFSALPLWMLLSSLIVLLRKKDALEQREADYANNRITACCLWLMILPGFSLVAELASILMKQIVFLHGDFIFAICSLLLIVCAGICFSRRKDVAAEKR